MFPFDLEEYDTEEINRNIEYFGVSSHVEILKNNRPNGICDILLNMRLRKEWFFSSGKLSLSNWIREFPKILNHFLIN